VFSDPVAPIISLRERNHVQSDETSSFLENSSHRANAFEKLQEAIYMLDNDPSIAEGLLLNLKSCFALETKLWFYKRR
jgi:hypothetical protein